MASSSAQQPLVDGNDGPLKQLLSVDQGEILDIIDTLRGYGITGDLNLPLPQIVVCGDQSSGKSSVLEAISGRPFPKGDNVCTTFPTELALRRDPSSSVSVRIIPAPSRDAQEASRLANFDPKSDGPQGFEATVRSAKEFLRKESHRGVEVDSYFKDTLHIAVSQPSLPPLTLIDLPGIIHVANKRQVQEDVDIVHDLVQSYLNDENSIILAVVSAQSDLETQAVLKMVKKADKEGQRTLGIITKPDLLPPASKKENTFVKCARNEEYPFELGWHVVKNQSSEQQPSRMEDRDREEIEFFSSRVWEHALKQDQLGIAALRTRLSNLLEERTRPALKPVVEMIQTSLSSCEKELDTLGQPRTTARDQAAYLAKISQRFQKICEQSVDGNYSDRLFFGNSDSPVDPRRLRAAVGNLNGGFATVMRTRGHRKEIIDDTSVGRDRRKQPSSLSSEETAHFTVGEPEPVDRDEWIRQIEVLARCEKSSEQPGLPNHRLIPRLFHEQSTRWKSIATEHIERVCDVAQEGLERIASHPPVSPPETSAAIRRHLISAEMERRHNEALKQLDNLLKPFQRNLFITLDDDFIRTVQSLKTTRKGPSGTDSAADVSSTDSLKKESPSTASYMLDYMLAYYKVSLSANPKKNNNWLTPSHRSPCGHSSTTLPTLRSSNA
jgi:GTP-binding protein EngB required for normal cell division